MPEDKANIMREFVGAMASGDTDKGISYLNDDVIWIMPFGTYKGKEAIKQVMATMARNLKNMKVTETGNGIMVQGEKAFFEHVWSGTYQGQPYEFLTLCAYEFNGDKIKAMRTTYDRLLVSQQCAKGWLPKYIVNMVVSQSAKAMK
jgi:ketosteroid isomerase-like protein